ncbi:MAG: adenosylhomocysteinase [Calditrichaceae bacterium]|nr:adenosylhomocysteinase [Calditrichia bacterium]NUQ41669.1 adenosylhomocysteinase [Calditrichaceae bacterium]
MMYHVKDLNLAKEGKRRIEWADNDMPVLTEIRNRFEKEKPLAGKKMAACLHITAETANLARTLKAGGADLVLCASNPLSTQDDVAAALWEHYGIGIFAIKGEDNKTYYEHIHACLKHDPVITMDDGADLVSVLHKEYPEKCKQIYASMEETTTGVIRLRAMHKDGALKLPVFAVNDAQTKHLFDNRYGTGQSTVDGIIRATDILLAGKTVVVAGYGWCGRGVATRMKGQGANVIITEVNPIRALEAAMDGFWVLPMEKAAPMGDLFVTLTGNISVLRKEHFQAMKDGAMVANSGHFNVEIDIPTLEKLAVEIRRGVRQFVDEYRLKGGKRIFLLGEGRLINLAAAEGHPASVMDMSFATQALVTEYALKRKLEANVYEVPREIEDYISVLKLKTMGIEIDALTAEQVKYLDSWEMGT